MPRGGREPSRTVVSILTEAEKSLWSAWENARNFAHHGDIGTAEKKLSASCYGLGSQVHTQ